ncbi:MAG TPA: universal stress protein [Actinomycetaceae bacterium]|nr:universal stress protein [Actinomycetaceae bacterium]
MAKTIITGVDGSDEATRAAHKAAELAQALGAELHVISAFGKFEMDTISTGGEEFVVSSMGEAENLTWRVAAGLRREFPDLEIKAAPAEGKPAEALVEVAERLDADLIVVGNKRVQGPLRVLGSVAREVAAHANCDVYVVHTYQR